jgi:hypothetical protein
VFHLLMVFITPIQIYAMPFSGAALLVWNKLFGLA